MLFCPYNLSMDVDLVSGIVTLAENELEFAKFGMDMDPEMFPGHIATTEISGCVEKFYSLGYGIKRKWQSACLFW